MPRGIGPQVAQSAAALKYLKVHLAAGRVDLFHPFDGLGSVPVNEAYALHGENGSRSDPVNISLLNPELVPILSSIRALET